MRDKRIRPLMTAGDVAHVLRVHVEVVRRWARDGRLPRLKVGGRLRFRPEAIEDFLVELEAEGAPPRPMADPEASEAYRRAAVRLDALGIHVDRTG